MAIYTFYFLLLILLRIVPDYAFVPSVCHFEKKTNLQVETPTDNNETPNEIEVSSESEIPTEKETMIENIAPTEDKIPTENELFWLEEFKAPTGEILNPYEVLNVPREANISQIKKSYRSLSKKYHPDATRFVEVLPDNCTNLDEVRDEWERIKYSYEILCNGRVRRRYDRQEALARPGEAAGRAAVDLFGKGLKGIFAAGSFVLDKINEKEGTDKVD